jgi:pterin-4a-carbinolamine dehydratase
MDTTNTTTVNNDTPAAAGTTQELKSSWVQEPAPAPSRKRVVRPDDQGGGLNLTQSQMDDRLKADRMRSRLRRMPEWRMQKGGKSIDRVREFPDSLSAMIFLGYTAVLAREAKLPLRVLMQGNTLAIALSGASKSSGFVDENVLKLAELLG